MRCTTRARLSWTWRSRWRWGGNALANITVLRADPGLYGQVASDPTVSRMTAGLAADTPAALWAINSTRAAARATAWKLADLKLRHRRPARCKHRIRISKDPGLRKLPSEAFAQNQIWCAVVALAGDLLAWMGMLALTAHEARRRDPKRLPLRLFTIPAVPARAAPG